MSVWNKVLPKSEREFIKERYGVEVGWERPTECFYVEPLFERCYRDLGFDRIESNEYRKTPDYFGWKDGEKLGIEIEIYSTDFKHHKHDLSSTDIIVCLKEGQNFEGIKIIELPRDLPERTPYSIDLSQLT